MKVADKYAQSPDHIKEPPHSLVGRLQYLGPGFVLSASIVGSGELIATTTLGAKAGFITFWIILLSCVIKVAIQLEFGRHAILHGETAMAAFNALPGKRFKNAHWSIWSFLGLMILKLTQLGGIVGGVAIILHMICPGVDVAIWAFVGAAGAAAIVHNGDYGFIEKGALVMIALFTLMTFASLYFLQFTEFALSSNQILEGLRFNLPKEAVAVAIGAFGITGVGGDEIVHYTYWCTEKGYARFTGSFQDNEQWEQRANGWLKVMYLDAILAMIVYTLVTAAFYLLGAAVLYASQQVPAGYEMVEVLSQMYTTTLGPGARMVFLVGALIVLFSTLFSALAAWTRQYSDIFGQIGWIDFKDPIQRGKSINLLAWILPLIWTALFLFFRSPVAMIVAGGIVTSVILFLVVGAGIHIRYFRCRPGFTPSVYYDAILWLSIATIAFVGIYGIVRFW